MKKIISLMCACAVLITASLPLIGGLASASDEFEGKTSFEIAKDMGVGINLGNTMEAYWLDSNREDTGAQTIGSNTPQNYETCWGAVVTTQEMINGMKNAGFNTVRIPVYWGNMMENDGTFTINSSYIARVAEIVQYCRNAGLYAVINIHHYDEFLIKRYTKNLELDKCAETFSRLWTQIAQYFKDYSSYLIFEGYNEYLGGGSSEVNGSSAELPKSEAYKWTNKLNQTFVDAVRATGGNNSTRMLIASGYYTNIDNTTDSRFVMPDDSAYDRLMVSVHYVDNAMYWSNKIGGDEWKSYSISQCEKLKKAFTEKGIPVFIGETTSAYDFSRFVENASVNNSSAALQYMLNLIIEYGFTPVLWDTSNNFYSRTNCKINNQSDAEVIKEAASYRQTMTVPTYTASSSSSSRASASVTTKASVTSASSSVKTAVKPKVAKVKKVKAVKSGKKIKVSWKKIKGANGYKISVGTNKKATKNKVIKTINNNKKKITVKIKKALNKKYYVKVRAYKNYKDAKGVTRKAWGAWSEAKKVKLR